MNNPTTTDLVPGLLLVHSKNPREHAKKNALFVTPHLHRRKEEKAENAEHRQHLLRITDPGILPVIRWLIV